MATLTEKLRLLRGLAAGNEARVGPLFVSVDVTSRCNLRCIGCRFHSTLLADKEQRDEADLDPALFRRLCGALRRRGTRSLTLTGEGEPLMHPKLAELVDEAKASGFETTLATNGTLLDERRINRLVDARLDLLRISLWAGTPEAYRASHPCASDRMFERVSEGLRRLARAKRAARVTSPRVQLHFPLSRVNHAGIEQMVDVARRAGCDAVSFSPCKTVDGQLDDLSLRPDEERQVRRALGAAARRLRGERLAHNVDVALWRYALGAEVWRRQPCYIAWLHARVLVDGTVLACHRSPTPMGQLERASFEEIWNGAAFRHFRHRGAHNEVHRDCDCVYCGFAVDNARVHRIFRWLAPLASACQRLRRR